MKEVFSPPNQQIKHLCFLDRQCSSYLRKHVLSYYTENGIHCFGIARHRYLHFSAVYCVFEEIAGKAGC